MAFKDVFDLHYIERLGRQLEKIGVLDAKSFEEAIAQELPTLEMKARVRLISDEIVAQTPLSYEDLMKKLVGLLDDERPFREGISGMENSKWSGFAIWPFTMIISEHGLSDWDTSFWAMNEFTRRFTAEFCIRPFLQADPERVFGVLNHWVSDPSEHVRRLVSEGTRPYLPWGMGVPVLSEHRGLLLEFLTQLRGDESEYVRRSVANHLNDLTRLDPDRIKDLCRRWLFDDQSHLSLVKHALRTLIKQGDPEALKLIGFGEAEAKCLSFSVSPTTLTFPGVLELEAEFECDGDILVDFSIEFVTRSGRASRKTFKWFVRKADSHAVFKRSKKVTLKPISTRQFHSGIHRVQLHVNGNTLGEAEFQLVVI